MPSAGREWLREREQMPVRTLCLWGGEVRGSEVDRGNGCMTLKIQRPLTEHSTQD